VRVLRHLTRAFLMASWAVYSLAQSQNLQLPPFPELSESQLDGFEASASEQIRNALQEARENPQDAGSAGRLGMVLHAYQLHDEAVACYERARLLDPEPFPWIYYLAKIRAAQGDDAQLALELYRKAVELNQAYLPARLQFIDALLQSGMIDEAGRDIAPLLEDRSDLAWVHYLAGRVKQAQGEINEAAREYQLACNLAPRFGPAHYALGLAYRRLGRPQEAQAHLQLYRENQASIPPIDDPLMEAIEDLKLGYYHLVNEGKRLYDKGRIDEAFANYTRAVDLNPRLIHAHVNLISIYAMRGDFQAAGNHYQAAVAVNPHLGEAHYNYGLALSQQKMYPQAEQMFRKAIRYSPYFADAYNNLGATLDAQGNLAEAEENYRKAIENNPAHREAYFSLGRIAVKRDKPQEAIKFFLQSLTPEDEKTPTFMYSLAYVYAGTRNFSQARHYGQKARGLADSYSDRRMVEILDRFLEKVQAAEAASGRLEQ